MKLSRIKSKALGAVVLAALLSAPAFAAQGTATPGTLNFVEGQASIENQLVTSKSVGKVAVEPGQTIMTGDNGRAEVLLTPGVFLRLGHNSAVKMISPDITSTQVQLEQGRAEVEVAELHKQNDLQVQQGEATTRLLKKGLYDFSADQVRVFKGQAQVIEGDRKIKVDQGHALTLDAPKLKEAGFKKKADETGLYDWSELRDEYLSEASANVAPDYINSSAWIGPGWYWDPFFADYTFLPGAGMLYSPFGPWGFYSPMWMYNYGPYLGSGYYGGYGGYYGGSSYNGPYYGGVGRPLSHNAVSRTGHFGVAGGPRYGGFHGGTGGFHGGGFAGGGFHGGGFGGGGFHR